MDLTSLTRAHDYEKIAAPELWMYRGETLSIYVFEDGHYAERTKSSIFGNIPVKELMPEYVKKV